MHAYVHSDMHTYIHAYIRTYTQICIYTYIHTYIHIHIEGSEYFEDGFGFRVIMIVEFHFQACAPALVSQKGM